MGIQLTQVGYRPTPLLPWTGDSMGDHDLDARAAYDSPHCCQKAARSEVARPAACRAAKRRGT